MVSISSSRLFPPGGTVSRIDLTSNANYSEVHGDSISVYLPYFGERQMGYAFEN